jgi:hypothetical protein
MDTMASTSATQLITICDEESIMFSFQIDVEIGLEATSNVEVDGAWGIFTLKLLANRSLWSPTHRSIGY